MAGTLQCKSVDYIKQLTGVLSGLKFDSKQKITIKSIIKLAETDKNVLNTTYYFIGKYVNLIFDNFYIFICIYIILKIYLFVCITRFCTFFYCIIKLYFFLKITTIYFTTMFSFNSFYFSIIICLYII